MNHAQTLSISGNGPDDDGFDLAVHVRRSSRARNMLLKLIPGKGLEVVLPPGADVADAAPLVDRKRAWIERNALRLRQQGADFSGTRPELPDTLEFRAVNKTVQVGYVDHARRLTLRENAGRITLSGSMKDHGPILRRLREYVRATAKSALPPLLRTMSERTGLGFDEVRVRCQKSQWGSCARQGDVTRISLNAKLLFLPPEHCGQVLLHELCHTRHHDHSAAYWALVERLNLQARQLEKELAQAWGWVPPWWRAALDH